MKQYLYIISMLIICNSNSFSIDVSNGSSLNGFAYGKQLLQQKKEEVKQQAIFKNIADSSFQKGMSNVSDFDYGFSKKLNDEKKINETLDHLNIAALFGHREAMLTLLRIMVREIGPKQQKDMKITLDDYHARGWDDLTRYPVYSVFGNISKNEDSFYNKILAIYQNAKDSSSISEKILPGVIKKLSSQLSGDPSEKYEQKYMRLIANIFTVEGLECIYALAIQSIFFANGKILLNFTDKITYLIKNELIECQKYSINFEVSQTMNDIGIKPKERSERVLQTENDIIWKKEQEKLSGHIMTLNDAKRFIENVTILVDNSIEAQKKVVKKRAVYKSN